MSDSEDREDTMDNPEVIRLRTAFIEAKHIAKKAFADYCAYLRANNLQLDTSYDSADEMDQFPPVDADDAKFVPSSADSLTALVGSLSIAPPPAPPSPPAPLRIEKSRKKVLKVNEKAGTKKLYWKIIYEENGKEVPDYQLIQ